MKCMVFPEIDSPKRKDEDFYNIDEEADDQHISARSPLLNVNIGLIPMFPLDYMHSVYLGVVRKLILIWYRGSLNVHLGMKEKLKLNDMLACSAYSPKEFQRKPCVIHEVDRWKATEFRSFLLYTGLVVLKEVLSEKMYDNFLCLHVALRIMLSKHLILNYLNYAEELLVNFVSHCSDIYGEEFLVYNVHALIHLADDVRRFGTLNTASAFLFESYLGQIKKLL